MTVTAALGELSPPLQVVSNGVTVYVQVPVGTDWSLHDVEVTVPAQVPPIVDGDPLAALYRVIR